MKALKTDPSIYRYGETRLYLVAWVDDWFVFYPKEMRDKAEGLWSHLQKSFDLPAWKKIERCLGCAISRDRKNKKIMWSMKTHLVDLLKAGRINGGLQACSNSCCDIICVY